MTQFTHTLKYFTDFDTSHSMFTQNDTVHTNFDIVHTHTLAQFTHISQAMIKFTNTLT